MINITLNSLDENTTKENKFPLAIDTEQYVKYKICNAPIMEYPFPHFYVNNIFPEAYYQSIIKNLPGSEHYININDAGRTYNYMDRFIIDFKKDGFSSLPERTGEFWQNLSTWLMGEGFLTMLIDRFEPYIKQRLSSMNRASVVAKQSGLLTRDKTGYSIGPHTDSSHKLLTLLFYLPKDDSISHLGTSIYSPKDPDFRCEGGAHYSFDKFKKINTMKFLPNTLFAFLKTDLSFHGVEVIQDQQIERDLIIYNVNIKS